MKDTEGYVSEINRLKEKYKGKIEIYLGVEEDSRHLQNRAVFDYIIGSCHYAQKDGEISPIDSNYTYFTKALSFFDGDEIALAEHYFSHFVQYIKQRKPDIIGHFDLITKFDEKEKELFLSNEKYRTLSEKYVKEALSAGSFFEINTGLITRGYRSTPCPSENLLRIIYKNGGGVVLSSDSHSPETLYGAFDLARDILKDIGFQYTYALKGGKWVKNFL
jgi:histidinol-phosphatase (PHP family)